MSPDGDDGYGEDGDVQVTMGVSVTSAMASFRWLTNCLRSPLKGSTKENSRASKKGQRAGDMIMPDGTKFNLLDMQKLESSK